MRRRTLLAALLTSPFMLSWQRVAAATAFINIGSGSTSGLYYPTALDMARIINKGDCDIRAYVRVTGASIDNCRLVSRQELQLGLTQNNIAFYAYNGQGIAAFKDKPSKDLRGLLMLYPEVIHVLVRKTANIKHITDLQGKRVYIGDFGSGTKPDVQNILSVYDMTTDDLRLAVQGNAGDAVNLLVDGQIDAMFYTVGIGSKAITDALETDQIDLLDIPKAAVDTLRSQFPFYTALTLPAGTYPHVDRDLSAVTLKAMLIASAQLPATTINTFMTALFADHIDQFRAIARNPNLRRYFRLNTALDGMPIPLHDGATAFFREQNIEIPQADSPTS